MTFIVGFVRVYAFLSGFIIVYENYTDLQTINVRFRTTKPL